MSWKQYARAAEADARRRRRAEEREATRRYRELQKIASRAQAADEVSKFDNYLDLLVSIHKDCGDVWDWQGLMQLPAPSPPTAGSRHQAFAIDVRDNYKPGFFDRLFGRDKKRLAELEEEIVRSRRMDEGEYDKALEMHRGAVQQWTAQRTLAHRLLNHDVTVYLDALRYAGAFDEVHSFSTKVNLTAVTTDVAAFACEITDDELVPKEEVKLTAGGKITSKAMAGGRYWTLYQDHVCSCAVRIARETFAVLPVSRVITNVGKVQTNTATGHPEFSTFLAVHFQRGVLQKLNLDNIDPSDSLKNFPHRMKFKKTSGFESVAPITPDEQWITT